MSSESKKYAALSSIPEKRIRELEELLAASIVRIRQLEESRGERGRHIAEYLEEHRVDMEGMLSKINDLNSEESEPARVDVVKTLWRICTRMLHAAHDETCSYMFRCDVLELELAEGNRDT